MHGTYTELMHDTPKNRCLSLISLGLALIAACSTAHALTASAGLGDVSLTVYAPDWTWQKQDINVLVVVVNKGVAPAEVMLRLDFPADGESDFKYAGPREQTVAVPPGESVRAAFTNITALDGVPRRTYTFGIVAESAGVSNSITYPVRTIRGAAVGASTLAALIPAVLAALWCLVLLAVMPRFGLHGAWRTPSASIAQPYEIEPWIDRVP